ncbi:MAG: hypothetical protein J5509_06965 [Lachnospiraceae bacterium]|nr:hypothetical protein [Lachnospiraceae bacterium]
MNKEEWKSIDDLRITDRELSGLYYSADYAKEHKNMKDWYSSIGDFMYAVEEGVYIKEDENGSILYCVKGRDMSDSGLRKWDTQFGTYTSDDRGEFGGELLAPDGKSIGGNFRFMFDLDDKVYAVSTSAHLAIAHTSILRFDSTSEYEYVYNTSDVITSMLDGNSSENLKCDAICVKDDEAYAVLTGFISEPQDLLSKALWVIRILKIKSGQAVCIKEYEGKSLAKINNLIVQKDKIYISCDKMVCEFDFDAVNEQFGNMRYRTCISPDDEDNLIRTEEELKI